MTRTHKVLVGLLAAQILLLVAVNFSSLTGAAASAEPRALLPELESFTPARIAIEDATKQKVVLERRDDGWVLPDAGGYPAQSEKVADLLDSLKEIEVRRPVVTSSRYHSGLKVTEDGFERRVRIWEEAASDPEVDLIVGTSPNYRITHLRPASADSVYEAMGFGPAEVRADKGSWIEKKFVDVPYDRITAVEVDNAAGSFKLARRDGKWAIAAPESAAGKELDQSKTDSFVRGLASIWLIDPVGRVDEAAHGLAEPAARVVLEETIPPPAPEPPPALEPPLAAGGDTAEASEETGPAPAAEPERRTVTYRLGGVKDEESGQRYVAKNGFEFAVTVSKYDAEKALAKKLDELLKKDVQETEAGAGSP